MADQLWRLMEACRCLFSACLPPLSPHLSWLLFEPYSFSCVILRTLCVLSGHDICSPVPGEGRDGCPRTQEACRAPRVPSACALWHLGQCPVVLSQDAVLGVQDQGEGMSV